MEVAQPGEETALGGDVTAASSTYEEVTEKLEFFTVVQGGRNIT